ncbi:MAG: hypothetical protein QHJ82_09715 [Verrucomicrobiota bacterium]|nr:hypothetical protein [Verrucomicrobiota bacterium]
MKRLLCCLIPLLLVSGQSRILSQGIPEKAKPWFDHVIVGMEVGPTGAQFGYSDPSDSRYCSRFDGREIVRRAVEAGVQYLVIWARDGDYAYYNSKLLPKAPGLGARDPLRETLDEARKHNLPVVAYCVVQQGGHFLNKHPEWEMRDPSGNRIGRFCFNSGYLEAMKEIVAEMLAYGIAGFHIDMLDQGFGPPYGCWCDACRARFEQEFGHAMPGGLTWDTAWDDMLEFRYRSSERFEKALAAHIKSINPDASVDFNYHGNPPFGFEVGQRPVQHAGNGDFITGETGVWGFSALTVGLNAEFYRAAAPHQRVQVAMQRGVRMYHDQTTRPLNDIRWELLTLLAHGAFVTMVDKTGFDGRLDSVAYERIGTAFREARAKSNHFGQKPVAEVGIYFSSRTRDWVGRDKPADYFQSFQGAHKALVYEHIPYGVLLDENVTPEMLGRFPIVMLPNAGVLSSREIGMLRGYVEKGGRLLVTGRSGLFDRMGAPVNESSLSELIGARTIGKLDSLDNWVRFESEDHLSGEKKSRATAKALSMDIRSDWPFLVKGPAVVYEPTSAAGVGELLKPHRTIRQLAGKEGTDWPMSADAKVGPAILINRVGHGQVITFACSPDYAAASEHHIVEARRMIRNAVRHLNPEPIVEISAPANVEAVVTDDSSSRTLRVHLLCYNAPPQTTPARERPYVLPGLIEDRPMFKAAIRAVRRIKHASALNRSTRLTRSGNTVEAVVEDIHDVVLLRY